MLVIIDAVNFDRKIPAIKAVRSITGCGLREAKSIIDEVCVTRMSAVVKAAGDREVVMGLLYDYTDAMDWRVTCVDEEDGGDSGTSRNETFYYMLRAMPPHLQVSDVIAVLDTLDI